MLAAETVHTTITPRTDGRWVLETVYPLRTGQRGWGVLILQSEAGSVRAQIRRDFVLLALFTSTVTSLLLLVLWYLLGHILHGLQVLVTAMDTVDFSDRTGTSLPTRQDEIGVLYQHFHRMQHRIDQSRHELLRAEHQIWHSERLAAIGRLASGLAHEINNPINGVRNCIYAIRGNLDDHQQTTTYLDLMDEGLTSASGVLQKLLNFARKQQTAPGPVNLNDAVQSVRQLVEYNFTRKGVGLELDLEPELPAVLADRQLMQEVIMNLLLNAVDAEQEGGLVQVRSRHESAHVRLAVQDSGCGIAPEIRDQIFDPFFTTKNTGEGTGLGLSICLSIVQASGGTLEATGTAGTGATFTISLPVMTADEPEASTP